MKLFEIADVFMGVTVLKQNEALLKKFNTYSYITLRSIKDNKTLDDTEFDKIKMKQVKNHFKVLKNDIIIGLSYPNYTAIVKKDYDNLIAPSQVAIIRAKEKIIDPAVLLALFDSKVIRHQLEKLQIGMATFRMKLKVSELENIEVKLPNLKNWHKIKQLSNYQQELINLNTELVKLTILQSDYYLNKLIEKED